MFSFVQNYNYGIGLVLADTCGASYAGVTGFPIDAEVEVFTHKNRKITHKIKIYASM